MSKKSMRARTQPAVDKLIADATARVMMDQPEFTRHDCFVTAVHLAPNKGDTIAILIAAETIYRWINQPEMSVTVH